MAEPGRFTSASLESKLRDLNSTMQSIQGVSQWLLTHKKYAKTIVGVWFREMQKGMYSASCIYIYSLSAMIDVNMWRGWQCLL